MNWRYKHWKLYKRWMNLRYGRGGWIDMEGYKEVFAANEMWPNMPWHWRWVQVIRRA